MNQLGQQYHVVTHLIPVLNYPSMPSTQPGPLWPTSVLGVLGGPGVLPLQVSVPPAGMVLLPQCLLLGTLRSSERKFVTFR